MQEILIGIATQKAKGEHALLFEGEITKDDANNLREQGYFLSAGEYSSFGCSRRKIGIAWDVDYIEKEATGFDDMLDFFAIYPMKTIKSKCHVEYTVDGEIFDYRYCEYQGNVISSLEPRSNSNTFKSINDAYSQFKFLLDLWKVKTFGVFADSKDVSIKNISGLNDTDFILAALFFKDNYPIVSLWKLYKAGFTKINLR